MASEPTPARSYRLGPRAQRATIVGIRPGQAAITAVGLVTAVGWLRTTLGPARIPGAVIVVLVAAALAFWPVCGRTLDQWVPPAARFTSASLTGSRRDIVDVTAPVEQRRPPSSFGSLSMRTINVGGRPVGAIADRRGGTLAAVISLGGHAFALLDEAERAQWVDRWSALLSSCASGSRAPYRLQWLERTVPDPATAMRAHLAGAFGGPRSPGHSAAQTSYATLVAEQTREVLRHELLLVVSVRASRRQMSARGADTPSGDDERLADAVLAVDERCRSVGLCLEGMLSPAGVRASVRRASALGTSGQEAAERTGSPPWPLAVKEHWSSLRTDGTWHVTYWIAEWPRSAVGSGFLLPMLLEHGTRRSVSVVMAPIAPARAVRSVEHARTEAVADREMRRRHGFALTARSSREQEAVLRREDELASGHAAYRFSGFVTVSANGEAALETACARVEQSAALAHLEVRRLYGNQLEAFLCTLPLGRGCR